MVATISPALKIPPLENGDKLTRREFERRYTNMPHVKKAELIEGRVFMSSPLRLKAHGKPHAHIITWLGVYQASYSNVGIADNATLRLDSDNEVQPDVILRLEKGGKSRITNDDYLEGAPEFIAEIAASSASYDLDEKFKVYRRNQVQEYLVWQVYDEKLDWFRLQEGEYIKIQPNQDGIICSEIFSGLWLDYQALLSGNIAQVLKVLQQGLSINKPAF
jgi:Uma2 family endonuclease